MLIQIDPSNGIPIFQQIIQQVKYKIAGGIVQPGEQLPSVRQLASQLRVNPNTVAKAYTELEREKVVITRRGMGCFVAETPVVIRKQEKIKIVSALFDRCLTEAFHLHLPWEDVETLFQERLKSIMQRSQS
ncbi:MAG: GntR family transcriptional regulator [bacterium]|jgi:GntR family transcriptional regulator|nr:GntR family transcriptional regulator [bacterium]